MTTRAFAFSSARFHFNASCEAIASLGSFRSSWKGQYCRSDRFKQLRSNAKRTVRKFTFEVSGSLKEHEGIEERKLEILVEEISVDTDVFKLVSKQGNKRSRRNVYYLDGAVNCVIGLPSERDAVAFLDKFKSVLATKPGQFRDELSVHSLIITHFGDDDHASLESFVNSFPGTNIVATLEQRRKVSLALPKIAAECDWQIVRSELDVTDYGRGHLVQYLPGRDDSPFKDSLFACDTKSGIWYSGKLFGVDLDMGTTSLEPSQIESLRGARREYFDNLQGIVEEDVSELELTFDEPEILCPSYGPVISGSSLSNQILIDYIEWTTS
mmetsp:Transcript_10570/g.17298  ORF Transcript_10570/g.17298 Transcript_10570/m.17298 type:complete len:326 (+) Transcript_10570:39-1016(+)